MFVDLIKFNFFYIQNLEDFRIANCDNVTGEFMYKLKERERSNELRIVLTHMNKEIDATQINVNIKINFLCRDFSFTNFSFL